MDRVTSTLPRVLWVPNSRSLEGLIPVWLLWNWSLEESIMDLDVFLMSPGRNTRINSIALLREAIENFEEFLELVFW